jgi:hypothetical protein
MTKKIINDLIDGRHGDPAELFESLGKRVRNGYGNGIRAGFHGPQF